MDERRHHERSEDYEFPRDRPERNGIQFDLSFNLGHVITAVTVIVSVALAYGSLKAKTDLHDIQIADVKVSVQKVDDKLTKLDDKASESNILLHELSATVRSEGAKTRANQQP